MCQKSKQKYTIIFKNEFPKTRNKRKNRKGTCAFAHSCTRPLVHSCSRESCNRESPTRAVAHSCRRAIAHSCSRESCSRESCSRRICLKRANSIPAFELEQIERRSGSNGGCFLYRTIEDSGYFLENVHQVTAFVSFSP